MENWMVLVASVILLSGFAFLVNVLYTDDMSGSKRVLMCGILVLLITTLIIVLAIIKNRETNEESSSPMKTVAVKSSIAANGENKTSSFVVEPNDTTEAGPFVSENYEKSYRSLRYVLDLELRGNPWTLARYLQAHDVLDEFCPSGGAIC